MSLKASLPRYEVTVVHDKTIAASGGLILQGWGALAVIETGSLP